jgi:hypothetical protein
MKTSVGKPMRRAGVSRATFVARRLRRTSSVSRGLVVLALGVVATTACGDPPPKTSRMPTLAFADSDGCGDIFVYKTSVDGLESIVVSADKARLGLGTEETEFDLSRPVDGLEVHIDVFPIGSIPDAYCSGIIFESDLKPTRWNAVWGTATIRLDFKNPPTPKRYKAFVRIENAVFKDGAGRSIRQKAPIDVEAVVGWKAE